MSESSNIFENDLCKIKMKRFEHFNIFIVDHLNLNSIRSKFEMVAEFVTNIDIFLGGVATSMSLFLSVCPSIRPISGTISQEPYII